MSILDTFALHGIIKKGSILPLSRRLEGGELLNEVLISEGVTKENIIRGLSLYYNLPFRDLGDTVIPFEILKYIPEDSASYYNIIPLAINNGILEIGITNPENIEARDALQFIGTKLEMPFKIFLISQEDFKKILDSYRGFTGEVTRALSDLEVDIKGVSIDKLTVEKEGGKKDDTNSIEQIIEDAPIAKITAVILRYATEGGASDIHIEHTGKNIRVRFRVDGELFTSLILPANVHSSVVARIKILASLKLDEKRKPQDGRFSAHIDDHKIDFRVSTFPAYYGEKVVLRILDTQKGIRSLNDSGFQEKDLLAIRNALNRPYGLILITGPTGSGKSTTLYGMLNELDKETQNIISLEDPVEYNIEGISQSQVQAEIGYTFANGLRTTLRQDPDIIMVGEIRDKETAQLAIQAALTGHLVLSTIHTNTAIGAIPRLIDMGIDPYLIAPTLILSIAQRLVKQICPGGQKKIPNDGAVRMMIDKQFQDLPQEFKDQISLSRPLNESVPTVECTSGTRGRIAVFEVFPITKEIEKAILVEPTEPHLWEIARKNGMLSMKEHAILKSMDGIVPFQEVNTL